MFNISKESKFMETKKQAAEPQSAVPVARQVDEIQLVQAKSAAQFALTPIGQQIKQFEVQQRMAQMYATSTIVPDTYRGNLGNCVIAIDMAMRMNAWNSVAPSMRADSNTDAGWPLMNVRQ